MHDSLRPVEQPAVKTTIVGGRPPGPGKGVVVVPRGIEVLVKKASVDPAFRPILLGRRAEAAEEIGLSLDPAEAAILNSIPAMQLEATIARTRVDPMSRAAFLGKAAALMLAALGAGIGCEAEVSSRGHRPGQLIEVVYQETDYKGAITYGLAEPKAFEARQAEVARMNKLLPKAYELARVAWANDPAHKGVPFPMGPPGTMQCEEFGHHHNKGAARADLEYRQARARAEAEDERAFQQAQHSGDAEPHKVSAREYHKWAAERLFEEKLKALLDAEAPKNTTPSPKT